MTNKKEAKSRREEKANSSKLERSLSENYNELFTVLKDREEIVLFTLDKSAYGSRNEIYGKIAAYSGEFVVLNPYGHREVIPRGSATYCVLPASAMHSRIDEFQPGNTNSQISIDTKYIVAVQEIDRMVES